jgi:hypothetical protein
MVKDAESCVKFQPWWLLLSHVPCETAAAGGAAAKRHSSERRTAGDSGGAGGAGHTRPLRMLGQYMMCVRLYAAAGLYWRALFECALYRRCMFLRLSSHGYPIGHSRESCQWPLANCRVSCSPDGRDKIEYQMTPNNGYNQITRRSPKRVHWQNMYTQYWCSQ